MRCANGIPRSTVSARSRRRPQHQSWRVSKIRLPWRPEPAVASAKPLFFHWPGTALKSAWWCGDVASWHRLLARADTLAPRISPRMKTSTVWAIAFRKVLANVNILVLYRRRHFPRPAGEASLADFDLMYGSNVRGRYLMIHTMLPLLRRAAGQIVFINSSAGLRSPAPPEGLLRRNTRFDLSLTAYATKSTLSASACSAFIHAAP